eukprot:scaffold73267_cov67-Phaeocystis_antarctica.AAC.3
MVSPQLLQQRLRRRPQLVAGAAQGHGEARLEHVAQLGEEDALLVTAQLRQRHRHRGARRARAEVVTNKRTSAGGGIVLGVIYARADLVRRKCRHEVKHCQHDKRRGRNNQTPYTTFTRTCWRWPRGQSWRNARNLARHTVRGVTWMRGCDCDQTARAPPPLATRLPPTHSLGGGRSRLHLDRQRGDHRRPALVGARLLLLGGRHGEGRVADDGDAARGRDRHEGAGGHEDVRPDDRDGHDAHARLGGHRERSLLEVDDAAVLGARPLGECDEAVPRLVRVRKRVRRGDGLPEGLHLRLAVAAAERDVPRELHRPADERDAQDLDLGDVPAGEIGREHEDVEERGVVRAVDDRLARRRQVLRADDRHLGPQHEERATRPQLHDKVNRPPLLPVKEHGVGDAREERDVREDEYDQRRGRKPHARRDIHELVGGGRGQSWRHARERAGRERVGLECHSHDGRRQAERRMRRWRRADDAAAR